MNSSFFIVADRGNLKAYRAESSPGGHSPRVELVQAFSFTEAHQTGTEKFTDEAGGFTAPTGGGSPARQQMSMGERHYDLEETRREVKQLAGKIGEILRAQQPERWSFAAPSEIQDAVLEEVEPAYRGRLAEKIARDLVNVPQQEVLEHFSAVRATPAAP